MSESFARAIQGLIFDLDGTLVDSGFDFEAIWRELQIPRGTAVLEAIQGLPEGPEKDRCRGILRRHEQEAADRATLMPGAVELLQALRQAELPAAILTRNSRHSTEQMVDRLLLRPFVTHILTREDAPPKPNPDGILSICSDWGKDPARIGFVGDYLFDIQAGQNAGTLTVLYAPESPPDYAHLADYVVQDLRQILHLWGLK